MKFLVYADVDEQSIASKLGKREYSYFFVLDGFRKALEKLGTVIRVQDPAAEVDRIWQQENGDCLFLSFTPPNHAVVGLQCPTLTVFAWEFSNVPYETWDEDPRNDWRFVFERHGRSIALSSYSARAVIDAMGENFPSAGIPVPVWDAFEGARNKLQDPHPVKKLSLDFDGHVLGPEDYSSAGSSSGLSEDLPEWNRRTMRLQFNSNSPDASVLAGFHPPEPWGVWSGSTNPFITLPVAVSGRVRIALRAHGLPANAERDIPVSLGSASTVLRLTTKSAEQVLEFDLAEPANQLNFRGVENVRPEGADKRRLGIGLTSMTVSDPDRTEEEDIPEPAAVGEETLPTAAGTERLTLEGVIYTSVFNPSDGRKNWVDLVTAFVYAHRHHADACLVLKMVTNDPESYMASLPRLLTQLAPFSCRVTAIRGYLPQDQFDSLVASTSYYVNASHCEGLCLPLMEFLSSGVPAVAPDHTAMADYVNNDLAFRVASCTEQNVWPDDPRDMFRTLRYRIDWESLRDAYAESYRVAKEDPERYRSMSRNAREQMRDYASIEAVANRIADFLEASGDA